MPFAQVIPPALVPHVTTVTPSKRPRVRYPLPAQVKSAPAVFGSMLVHGALLYLAFLKLTPTPEAAATREASGRSLTVIDVSEHAEEQEQAPSEKPAISAAEPIIPKLMAPAPLQEWTMVELRSPVSASATAQKDFSATAAGSGANSGSAGASGDDPYAGAAFRPRGNPNPSAAKSNTAILVAPFLAVEINRAQLETALLSQTIRLAGSGFSLYLKVDAEGRAIDVKVLAATSRIDARTMKAIRTALLGRMLVSPGSPGGAREMVIGPISIHPG